MKKYYEITEPIKTVIISAFPGTGKTQCVKDKLDSDSLFKFTDSDSSRFSWIEKNGNKERNLDFPNNYFDHINKEYIGKKDYVFISTHKEVRDYMTKNNIYFNLVYPHRSLKDEYIMRYKARGNDPKFIKMMYDKWDGFIEELENEKKCTHTVLNSGQYINDIFSMYSLFTNRKKCFVSTIGQMTWDR